MPAAHTTTPRVVEIVLTGGACGGKTTALTTLAHMLRTRGTRVITVPEAFTMMVAGGMTGTVGDMVRADGTANCSFQAELFSHIRKARATARAGAQGLGRDLVVILYDRGELDAKAFHDHICFDDLATAEGQTLEQIRDSYDGVLHLVTTADGAVDFYTQLTNDARWERPSEARASDGRLLRAWQGHSQHHIVDNSTDFTGKVERLLAATIEVINGQLTLELVGRVPDMAAIPTPA